MIRLWPMALLAHRSRCITSALGPSQPVPSYAVPKPPRPDSPAYVCLLGLSGHLTRQKKWLCPLDRRRPLPLHRYS